MANKIDSNATGLRFAEEASLGVLIGSPIWYPLEPNSYNDFGGQIATVARTPISATRQNKKGTTTDLDASGGWNQDLTMSNLTRLLQSFFFAAARQKVTNYPLASVGVAMGAILASADDYTAASGLSGILSGALIYASGFSVSANNGLKVANAASSGTAASVADGLADEATPPAAAKIEVVGHEFASATMDIAMNGSLVRLSRVSGAFDLTTLPLIVGEWIYLGDDTAGNRFVNNVGFARISAIATTYLEFDKTSWAGVNEAGTGKLIRIYFGTVIRNEPSAANIVRKTVQLERTLGNDANGTMSEYIVGAVANELTLNIPTADKVAVDLSFVGIDNEQRDGTTGVKSGSRPALAPESALNTSSDFSRIKLSSVSITNANVTPLFAFASDIKLTVNNNVSANKAIGTLGAFDTTAGNFDVNGTMEVYFADIAAVQAVRNNADITLDFAIVKDNKGILFDIPLIALGDGRLNVEKDQPIKLPLSTNAAESAYGYTLLFTAFPYLPTLAA